MYKKIQILAAKWKKYPNKEQFKEIQLSLNNVQNGKRLCSSGYIFTENIEGMLQDKFPCIIFKVTFRNTPEETKYYENKIMNTWEKLDQYLVTDLIITDIQ